MMRKNFGRILATFSIVGGAAVAFGVGFVVLHPKSAPSQTVSTQPVLPGNTTAIAQGTNNQTSAANDLTRTANTEQNRTSVAPVVPGASNATSPANKETATNSTANTIVTTATTPTINSDPPKPSATITEPACANEPTAVAKDLVLSAMGQVLGVAPSTLKVPHPSCAQMTLADADQTYWNYIGIPASEAGYQPGGGDVTAWGRIIGLNDGISGSVLTSASLTQFQANLQAIQQHYKETSAGVYELREPVGNFAHNYYQMTEQDTSQATEEMYRFYNHITVTVQNGTLVFRVPAYPINSRWQGVVHLMNTYDPNQKDFQVSTDGGQTWTSVTAYNSAIADMGGMSTPPSYMWVKPNNSNNQFGIMFWEPRHNNYEQLDVFSVTYSTASGIKFGY